MVGQRETLRPSAVIGTASGNAAPRKRCATLSFHPRPFLPGQLCILIHPFPVLRVLSRSQGLAAVLHPVLVGSPPGSRAFRQSSGLCRGAVGLSPSWQVNSAKSIQKGQEKCCQKYPSKIKKIFPRGKTNKKPGGTGQRRRKGKWGRSQKLKELRLSSR